MAGYQESRYSFKVTGGSANYTDEDTGERYSEGFPSDLRVGAYRQHYKMPYVGITGRYRYQNFEVGGTFKYSGWVHSSDNDEHYLRDITFRSKVKNQNYYSLAADLGYYVTPNAKVYVEGNWSRVTNKKGDMSAYNYAEGWEDGEKNSSGIENYSFMTTVGLKYTF